MSKEAMKLALEAITTYLSESPDPSEEVVEGLCDARAFLRKALAEQPAQRKPLTDEEIWREYRFLWPFHPEEERKLASDILMFARAIEAAHGIKENT